MVEITSGQAAIVIAVVGHAFASVWWASKQNASSEFMAEKFINIKDELMLIRRELEKRDEQIKALWKKVDTLHNKVAGMTSGG